MQTKWNSMKLCCHLMSVCLFGLFSHENVWGFVYLVCLGIKKTSVKTLFFWSAPFIKWRLWSLINRQHNNHSIITVYISSHGKQNEKFQFGFKMFRPLWESETWNKDKRIEWFIERDIFCSVLRSRASFAVCEQAAKWAAPLRLEE